MKRPTFSKVTATPTPERTRQHYIASLSRNHVKHFIALQGHVTDVPREDYGYDLNVTTFDYRGDATYSSGYVEPGNIWIQLKSTDTLETLKTDRDIICVSVDNRHVRMWLAEPMPVILILYSTAEEKAYWVYVQPALSLVASHRIIPPQKELTFHIPRNNIVDEGAIEQFRQIKNDTTAKAKQGLILYAAGN